MSRKEKLIAKMRMTPYKIRYEELLSVSVSEGFIKFNQKGSHVTFKHKDGRHFTVTIPHGREAYLWVNQVKEFLRKLGL